jgi:hypothetical protein
VRKLLTPESMSASRCFTRAKLSLCLQHHDVKTYGEAGVKLHSFLASSLDGGESAVRII